MRLTFSATTFAAVTLLLETTDLANAKRLTEPTPPSAAEDSHHKPRALSLPQHVVINNEKSKQLPPAGAYNGFANNGIEASDSNQDFNTHIVGGTEASLGAYPYFVDMNVVGCGGALIAPQVVLSAAHCGDGGSEYVNEQVIVGAYEDDSSSTTGASSVTVEEQQNHPNYDGSTMENDFMLLKLATPVNIATPRLSIATSGGSSDPSAGTTLTVIGVGLTTDGGSTASTLREVDVPVVEANECNDLYGGGIATDVMFCAGTCRQDSIEYQDRVCLGTLFSHLFQTPGFCTIFHLYYH